MRVLAILTDRDHKRCVRNTIHHFNMEVDFYEPDEIDTIETHRHYDRLITAASLEDADGDSVIQKNLQRLGCLKLNQVALIDNGDSDYSERDLNFLSEYHLEQELTSWLQKEKALLYVSDDKLMHAIVKNIFKEDSLQLIHAYDGESGYRLYTEFHPNLILTDLDLPILDGLGLLARIKIQDKDERTKIILFSSTSDEATILKAYSLKAKGYLVKPMPPLELKHKLEKYL